MYGADASCLRCWWWCRGRLYGGRQGGIDKEKEFTVLSFDGEKSEQT